MAVPSVMSDLALAAASNSPGGTEAVGTNLDDYLRAISSIVRSQYSLASSSVASAATTVVSTSDGESVAITGTTTISSLGTGYAGCVRELRFSTTVTLTHSNNLWLGGSNITTQSGDVLRFRCISAGVWWLIAHSRSLTSNNVNTLAIVTGAVAVNCSLGDYFTLAATAAMTSFVFNSLPGPGKAQTIHILITQDATGSRVATWPASFKWPGGVAGVLSTAANAKDRLRITTFDQGTTWTATLDKAYA